MNVSFFDEIKSTDEIRTRLSRHMSGSHNAYVVRLFQIFASKTMPILR